MTVYTSITSPLRISKVSIPQVKGLLGLILYPGKKGLSAKAHVWDRDLETDLSAIVSWRAQSLVSLLEFHEFELLNVQALGKAVQKRGINWYHFEVVDGGTPDGRFTEQWPVASSSLIGQLQRGENVLVHCRGGLGRTGTVGSILLIDAGVDVDSAIDMVRKARPGSIENRATGRICTGVRSSKMCKQK